MYTDAPFSRERRRARDRIAELQRRSRATQRRGGGQERAAVAKLDVAYHQLSDTGEEPGRRNWTVVSQTVRHTELRANVKTILGGS